METGSFTQCSYFIQKPFTQSTFFLHLSRIYFNHRQRDTKLSHKKRLQDFFHNTRADKKLSALLPFNNTFSKNVSSADDTFFTFGRIRPPIIFQFPFLSKQYDLEQPQKKEQDDSGQNHFHCHILFRNPAPQSPAAIFLRIRPIIIGNIFGCAH